jgi:hypothetical protein
MQEQKLHGSLSKTVHILPQVASIGHLHYDRLHGQPIRSPSHLDPGPASTSDRLDGVPLFLAEKCIAEHLLEGQTFESEHRSQVF